MLEYAFFFILKKKKHFCFKRKNRTRMSVCVCVCALCNGVYSVNNVENVFNFISNNFSFHNLLALRNGIDESSPYIRRGCGSGCWWELIPHDVGLRVCCIPERTAALRRRSWDHRPTNAAGYTGRWCILTVSSSAVNRMHARIANK